ncbi:MAG: hypothetical protein WCC10_16055 [Tumebacillaceae bacterium]
MFSQQASRKLSSLVAATMLAGLLMPAGLSSAATTEATSGNPLPLTATFPAADSKTVRPDTKIELQLDKNNPDFSKWDKQFRDEVTLTLLNDGGQAVYSSTDSELQYDPATGKLSFTPPAQLDRYTKYGVVITPDKLPASLRTDSTRKKLPKQPAFKIEPVDKSTQPSALEKKADALLLDNQTLPSVAQQPQAPDTSAATPDVIKQIEQQEYANLQSLQQAARTVQVGPDPVRAVNSALKPIDAANGGNQKGVIESIEGSTVTLFGGTQFNVDADTHIHVKDAGQDTLADLHAGDLVTVTVNAHSEVQNINVTTPKDVVSFVFETGSALHEPTHVTLEQKETAPRVTDDGHFTIVSTDDYGLPAWGSETKIELEAFDSTTLHESAAVLPSASFTTTNQNGRTDVTVVDHFPQRVAAKVSMDGPNFDGLDGHGLVAVFDFHPGLPANIALQAPETVVVGQNAGISGTVTDIYGNKVEDGSAIGLTATQGNLTSPVSTVDGAFNATYDAGTKAGDVTLSAKSEQGTAQANATVRLLPDVPANMTFDVPNKLQAGAQATLSGTVTDQYGNGVLDGTALVFSATAGTLPAQGSTANGGAFQLDYTAPTKVQTVSVAASSVEGTAHADGLISIVPGPVAALSIHAQKTTVLQGETTDINGTASDQYNNMVEGQSVALQAEKGTLTNTAPVTDALGTYASQYKAPTTVGNDTVTATAGDATASVMLNVQAVGGTGYNPITKKTEPVKYIRFVNAPGCGSSTPACPNGETMIGQAISLKGFAYNQSNQILQQVVLSEVKATAGTVESYSPMTDSTGAFTLVYRGGDSAASVTITVGSGTITGLGYVKVTPYGWGFNAQTGAWEKVNSITIDSNVVQGLNKTYSYTYRPDQQVVFTGTARNASNQPLSQVQFDRLTATAGTLAIGEASNGNGQFTLTYTAPSTEGNQIVQIGSGNNITTAYLTITRLGQGRNPATGQWEDVASIVFNPNTYSVTGGGSVTLTGSVKNAAGQPLSLAKVLISLTGGTATNQVVSGLDGSFSLTYISPSSETSATYTVKGYVDSVRFGTATINVAAPPPAYFVSPYLQLWTPLYGSDYVEFHAYPKFGDGRAMTPSNIDRYFVLDIAFHSPIADYMLPNYNGYLSGAVYGVVPQYTTYSSDRYGWYENNWYWFALRAMYNDGHYASPSYDKSWNVRYYHGY